MKKSWLMIIGLALAVSACSLQNLDDTEGVRWEHPVLESDLVAGVALLQDLVFYADNRSRVFAVNVGTGTYSWSLTFSNNTILSLYAEGDRLYVLTSSNSYSYIYKVDPIYALLDTTAPFIRLPINVHPKVLTEYQQFGSHHVMYVYDSNTIIGVDLVYMNSNLGVDVSAQVPNLVSVVGEDPGLDGLNDYFWLIGRDGTLSRFDSFMTYSSTPGASPLSGNFLGSALVRNNALFVGTDQGLHKVDTSTGSLAPPVIDTIGIYRGQMFWNDNYLFVPSGDPFKKGAGRYKSNTGLTDERFYTSFTEVTWSPVVLDIVNNVTAVVDDQGTLHVMTYDMLRILDKYLAGELFHGDVSIPVDTKSDIYIPFVDKIVCYSLEWAANQREIF